MLRRSLWALWLLLLQITYTADSFALERKRPWTPQEAHAFVHQVIEQWLDNEDEKAKELIETVLTSKRATELDPETRAALLNLSARLLWLDAKPAFGKERFDILKRAEYRALQALLDVPMNLLYWRDYINLAVEGRGREHVWKTMTGRWVYRGHVPTTYTFVTEEQRAMGRASLHLNERHDSAAIKELRTFLARQPESCSARAYLSQLLHDLGQTDAAKDVMAVAGLSCRQHAFVARFESTLADVELPEVDSIEIAPTSRFSEKITVYGEKIELHRADLENMLLQDPTRLDRWYSLWMILHERPDDARAREYEKVIALARRIQPSFEIDIADVHGQVGRGEFRKALTTTTKLLHEHRGDKYLHALNLLCGAALGDEASLHDSDVEVVRDDAPIASCIRQEQVQYCLDSDARCVRGAMVRRHSKQFPAAAFERGWPIYSPADMLAYADWRVDAEAAERLNGMNQLREEMLARNRDQDEQLAALSTRLDVMVMPKLEQLTAQVRQGEITQAELRAEMKRERARTTKELERLSGDIRNAVTVMYRQFVLTQDQLDGLSLRIAANTKAIDAIDVNRFADLFERYINMRPREATIIHYNIMDQLKAAEHSDTDVAQLVPAIMDECVRKQVPSPDCLRKLLQLLKKHVSVQVPIVPTIISLDLLGIRETVLELWSLLQKMYPPDGRTT